MHAGRFPGWRCSPLCQWSQVRVAAVQQALRERFAQWGLPARIRVDNGVPWATWSDPPRALVLWWLGLGIEPLWNHPHSPREDPKVERSNGLIDAWGEPSRCPDYPARERRPAVLTRGHG